MALNKRIVSRTRQSGIRVVNFTRGKVEKRLAQIDQCIER